jgi:hypothetical protein
LVTAHPANRIAAHPSARARILRSPSCAGVVVFLPAHIQSGFFCEGILQPNYRAAYNGRAGMGPLLFETMKPGSRHDRAAIDSLSIMFRLSCERLKPHVLRAFEVRVR